MQHDVHTRCQCLICCPDTCSIAYRQAQGIGRTRARILHRGRWLDRTQPPPLLWPQPTATLYFLRKLERILYKWKSKQVYEWPSPLLSAESAIPLPHLVSSFLLKLKNPYTQQKKTSSTRNVCLKSYLILSREQQPFQGRYSLYHLL